MSESTEVRILDAVNIATAFATPQGVAGLLDKIKADVSAEVPDVTTAKGRARIASLAHKVSKAKVLVDDFGKELVAEEKKRLALIDADRKTWRDGCDALRDEIRKPLTEWEQAEADRVQAHKDGLSLFRGLSDVSGLSAADIINRITDAENVKLGDHWQEFAAEAGKVKDEVLASLRASLAVAEKREAEAAELARLRAEAAAREQQERDRLIAEAAANKARAEAESKAQAERDAAMKAQAEAEAKIRAEAEAAERARIAAEQAEARAKAEAEAAALREQEQKRLRIEAEERAKREAQEAAERAERQRIEAVESERKRAAEQQAHEQREREQAEAARLADKEYRRKIHIEIMEDMKASGISEDDAKVIISVIAKGAIRHVAINY